MVWLKLIKNINNYFRGLHINLLNCFLDDCNHNVKCQLMSLRIFCEGVLKTLQPVPLALVGLALPGATAGYLSTGTGHLIFNDIPGSSFSISYGRFLPGRRLHIVLESDEPTLEIYLAFKSRIHYEATGIGKVVLLENQFALRYMPFMQRTADLENRSYETVSIRFTAAYLDSLLEAFPSIRMFVDAVVRNEATNFTYYYPYATKEMMRTLQNIFSCGYCGALRKRYLDAQVESYVLQALFVLTRRFVPQDQVLKEEEIIKIKALTGMLSEEPGQAYALDSLAHAFQLDNAVLRRGFRQLYGVTVFDYLLKMRMEKALKLLLQSDKPEREIAFALGFADVTKFVAAFVEAFGQTPEEARQ